MLPKAETALFRSGFADHDIDVIGVLSGHAPDVSSVLFAMGPHPYGFLSSQILRSLNPPAEDVV
jgi:hypothetical protein